MFQSFAKVQSAFRFPRVEGFALSSSDTALTSHTVLLPQPSLAGDLLFVMMAGAAGVVFNVPAGWTNSQGPAIGGAGTTGSVCQRTMYQVADGSNPASVTVTSAEAMLGGFVAYRISNSTNVPTRANDGGQLNITDPDPPLLDTLWTGNLNAVEFIGIATSAVRSFIPGEPYDSEEEASGIGSGGQTQARMAVARRVLSNQSIFDPVPVIMAQADAAITSTFAVQVKQ